MKVVIMVCIYLALGDSITAGYGVDRLFSFPVLYGNFLRRHNPDLSINNQGVNGLTTHGLFELLEFNRTLRHLISQASLITITIGSNDLLHLIKNSMQSINIAQLRRTLYNMKKSLNKVGVVIRQLNPRAVVKVATLYNPLSAGFYSQYHGLIQEVIDTVNALIINWARQYGFVVVYLDREIRKKGFSLISSDNLHPNAYGYSVIAKAFARPRL